MIMLLAIDKTWSLAGPSSTGINVPSSQARWKPGSDHLIPVNHITPILELGAAIAVISSVLVVIESVQASGESSRGRGKITVTTSAVVSGIAAAVSRAVMMMLTTVVLSMLAFAYAVVMTASILARMTMATMLPVTVTIPAVFFGAAVRAGRGRG